MRVIFILIFLSLLNEVKAQNEFAAKAFYSDFNKIYADAMTGFREYRGVRRKNRPQEFETKLMLPLADSGRIVHALTDEPYAEFFFEPSRKKSDADKRSLNLREALVNAIGKPIYTRTESSTFKNITHSTTYFYTDSSHVDANKVAFVSRIYPQNNKYQMCFRIVGKKEVR